MGRQRLPAAGKSPYITAAGFSSLQQEIRQLWEKRAAVTVALAAAAAEGDRSENAEYIYRKKELAGIDRRIRYLQKRMPDLKVVHNRPDNPILTRSSLAHGWNWKTKQVGWLNIV